MTVYFEYVIIDNLVINALLLWLTFRTVKQHAPKLLILLAAGVGTGFALLMPLVEAAMFRMGLGIGGTVLMFVIKLFVGAFVVFIVQNKSLVRYILFFLIFVAYTFAFGGAVYGIVFAFTGIQGSLLYFSGESGIPLGALVGAIALFAWIMVKLVKFLNLRHSINNYLRDVVITYNDEKFKITSYLDTGNRLVDPKSNAPVVIITLSLFLKMFPDITADRVVLNKLSAVGIADGHYIPFSTVDKAAGKMFVFAPTRFEIIDKKKPSKTKEQNELNVRLGVSMRGFKDAVQYDALLNAHLV